MGGRHPQPDDVLSVCAGERHEVRSPPCGGGGGGGEAYRSLLCSQTRPDVSPADGRYGRQRGRAGHVGGRRDERVPLVQRRRPAHVLRAEAQQLLDGERGARMESGRRRVDGGGHAAGAGNRARRQAEGTRHRHAEPAVVGRMRQIHTRVSVQPLVTSYNTIEPDASMKFIFRNELPVVARRSSNAKRASLISTGSFRQLSIF